MKRICSFLVLFSILVLGSCEKHAINFITLENHSDFDVTVELYTGTTNDDGSMFFEDYSSPARSSGAVGSEASVVYANGYTPSESVVMDIDDAKRKIIFTNK